MPGALDLLYELSVVDDRLRDRGELDAVARQTIDEQRSALRKQIPEPLLMAYNVLQRAGRHPPVATVLGGTCSGCNLQLPPQLANEIRYGAELRSCPHCRRLLGASAAPDERGGRE